MGKILLISRTTTEKQADSQKGLTVLSYRDCALSIQESDGLGRLLGWTHVYLQRRGIHLYKAVLFQSAAYE